MTAELFSSLSELPSSGIGVDDVVVMGTTRQGSTAVVGLGLTIDRRGFALLRTPWDDELVLPWPSVVAATCREVTTLPDGRSGTVLTLTTSARVVRMLLPFEQISSEQARLIDRSIPHWAARFGGQRDLGGPATPPSLPDPFEGWLDDAPHDEADGARGVPRHRRGVLVRSFSRGRVAGLDVPRPVALGIAVGTATFLIVGMTIVLTSRGSPSRPIRRSMSMAAVIAPTPPSKPPSSSTSSTSTPTSPTPTSPTPTSPTPTPATPSSGSTSSTPTTAAPSTTPTSALEGTDPSPSSSVGADQISTGDARAEQINVREADLPAGWTVDTSGDVADSPVGGQVETQVEQQFGQCMRLTTTEAAGFFGSGAPASAGPAPALASSPTFDAPGDTNIQIASDVRTFQSSTDGTSDFAVVANPQFGACYGALESAEIQQELDAGGVGDSTVGAPAVVATAGTPSAVMIPMPASTGELVVAYRFTVPVTLSSGSPIAVETYLVAIFAGLFEAEIDTLAFGETFPPAVLSAVTSAVEGRATGG